MAKLHGVYQYIFVAPADVNPATDEVVSAGVAVERDQHYVWILSMSWDDPWYQKMLHDRVTEIGVGRLSQESFERWKAFAREHCRTPERSVCVRRKVD